ncbi:MAG TPA: hypothetical protein VFN35_28940 [Ktedonobacteraceae bacterium]|nr:hypothetical protein [Ktedonobacteraceae bacterium]
MPRNLFRLFAFLKRPVSIWTRFLVLFTLLLTFCTVYIESSKSAEPLPISQQYNKSTGENDGQDQLFPHDFERLLSLAKLPFLPDLPSLSVPNYPEDRAVREAILAGVTQWHEDQQTRQAFYSASNNLAVYLDMADNQASDKLQTVPSLQPEGTLLTARILLGLWASKWEVPQLSFHGKVVVSPDEVLMWRGIQKHRRLAYSGSRKQFSDGYPWKQRKQVQQDITLLSQYRVLGQRSIISQGRVQSVDVNAPYLSLTPLKKEGKVTAYLVSPGDWISAYEEKSMHFFARVDRRLFELNPRNDYLALRMGFYLTEHWRRHAHTGKATNVFCMSQLLSASMIPIEKANLTSRFAPRIEAALQKLYAIGLLGEPPLNLSHIDMQQAYWGKAWLASSWRLVPSLH